MHVLLKLYLNKHDYHSPQGRIRLKARWTIAQGPRLSRGPKKGKSEKKAYENRLSWDLGGPQNKVAQGPEDPLAQGPEDP